MVKKKKIFPQMVLENHTQDYIENDILPSKVESLWRKS